MTCPGDGSIGSASIMWAFQNWARTRTHIVPILCQPTSVAQLVAAVQSAERVAGVARAIGSGWSYPDVAIAPGVTLAIGTDSFFNILSGTDPMSPDKLIPFALKDAARADARHFIHVEAGIKVHELNCKLDALGLAMITLGGSNGQSLAGAISTGTHGSDVDLPPLADAVQAIHLVGPGGQEWWIERSGSRGITDPARMAQARSAGLLCNSIRIEYDDLLFNAVLVSVGRMGVVYSYVVRVRDAFLLEQVREKKPWTEVSTLIRTGIRDGLAADTQFVEIVVNPYKNTAGDHDCVITRKNTVEKPTTPPGGSSVLSFEFFCNITAMNPVLTMIENVLLPLIAATGAAAAATASAAVLAAAATAAAATAAGLPLLLAIPFIGPALFAAAVTAAATAAAVAVTTAATAGAAAATAATTGLVALKLSVMAARDAPGNDLAQKVTSILNTMTSLGHKELVPLLTEQLLLNQRNPNEQLVQKSFQLLTGQKPCNEAWAGPPECLRQVNGLEYALDLSAGSEKLFGFIDDVIALTDEFLTNNMPAGFVLSLRFTKGTEALIGMQQFSRTCSVEFIMLRGMTGESDFLQRLYAIATRHDAIPHWGLIHEIDVAEVSRLYGNRLRDWRLVLGRLIQQGGGKSGTFSSAYTVTRGLEPIDFIPPPTIDISFLAPLLLSDPEVSAAKETDISFLIPLLLSEHS